MSRTINTAGAILTVDLDIIRDNYARLCQELGGTPCAVVVKADAYGLGLEEVAGALWDEGADTFFVAFIDEGIELREILPDADIHILGGLLPDTEDVFLEHNLIPVLNSIEQIKRWDNRRLCDLQVDTGMTRLGIPLTAIEDIPRDLNVDVLLSHFACADDKDHLLNQNQIDAFKTISLVLPHKRASLANSAGIFLSEEAHFDLGRPGCALYGINPAPHADNPMKNPVRLQGKIIQLYEIDSQLSVGYGALHKVRPGQKIATVALGYADGYLRSLSSKGIIYINNVEVPVVGRVSMDAIAIDVSGLDCHEGQLVDVIGPNNPPDRLAKLAGTIGYEILTSLGGRYHRVYEG